MGKLTDKQEMFCLEYIAVDLNATQAAINAGYSEATAKQIGSENLSKPDIQGRIAELKAERVERTKVDADDIVKQLDEYRRSNIADYVELKEEKIEGTSTQVLKFKNFNQLTDEQKRCIESIKMGKHGIELKLHGTEWSVEKLNRHIGFYEEDNKQGKSEISINFTD